MINLNFYSFLGRLPIILMFLLSGCGSFFNAVLNDPTRQDIIEDENDKLIAATVSLSAERRIVLIDPEGKFCAEPPPDVAKAISTKLVAAINKFSDDNPTPDAQAKFIEDITQEIQTLFTKDTESDVFRSGIFAICQYHLVGALEKGQVAELFEKLVNGIVSSIKAKGDVPDS